MNQIYFVVVLLGCASSQKDSKDDIQGWLNWRGPQQNGTSLETGLPDKWEVGGINDLWDIDLQGRGTPVIANGRLYSWGYPIFTKSWFASTPPPAIQSGNIHLMIS